MKINNYADKYIKSDVSDKSYPKNFFSNTRLLIVKKSHPKINNRKQFPEKFTIPLTFCVANSLEIQNNMNSSAHKFNDSKIFKESSKTFSIRDDQHKFIVKNLSVENKKKGNMNNPEQMGSFSFRKKQHLNYCTFYQNQIDREIAQNKSCLQKKSNQMELDNENEAGLSKMIRISKFRPSTASNSSRIFSSNSKTSRCRCHNKSEQIHKCKKVQDKKEQKFIFSIPEFKANQWKKNHFQKIRYSQLRRIANDKIFTPNTVKHKLKAQPKIIEASPNKPSSPKKMEESWRVQSWQVGTHNSKFLQLSSSKNQL